MPILERTFPFHYRWVTFYNAGTNWTVVYKELKPTGMLSLMSDVHSSKGQLAASSSEQ